MALTEKQKQWLESKGAFSGPAPAQSAPAPEVDEAPPARVSSPSSGAQYSPYGISPATSSGEGLRGFQQGAGAAATEALRYGVPVAATMVGGPAAGTLARAGAGVLGGMIGEQAAQETEISRGVREFRSPGATVASGVVSAVPGGKGFGGTIGRAALDGATNVAAEAARGVIDEGKLPEWKQLALAGALGLGTGSLTGIGGPVTTNKVLKEIDTISRERYNLFKKMRPSGFKVSPDNLSEVGTLNWLAGRSQVANRLSLDNQVATQKYMRKALGSKGGDRFKLEKRTEGMKTPLKDQSEIRQMMNAAGEPMKRLEKYSDEITDWATSGGTGKKFAGLTPDQVRMVAGGKQTIKDLRATRTDKSNAWKSYANTGEQKHLDEFKRLGLVENELDNRIDEIAKTVGDGKLLGEIKQARIQLSKLFVAENVVDPATGLVELARLRPMLGKVPLTGELDDLAKFASMFEIDSRPVASAMMDSPANLSMRLTGTAAASGAPVVAATSFAMPVLGRGARAVIADPRYQRLFVKPTPLQPESIIGRAMRLGIMGEGREEGGSEQSLLADMMIKAGMGEAAAQTGAAIKQGLKQSGLGEPQEYQKALISR